MIRKLLETILIKRKRLLPVLFILIILAGIVSFMELPLEYMSGGKSSTFSIEVRASSLTPIQVEREICDPIESELLRLQGIRSISSSSTRGKLSMNIRLEEHASTGFIFTRISEVCDRVYQDFPENVSRPVLRRYSNDDMPVVVFRIKTESSAEELEQRYSDMLGSVDGISRIQILGAPSYRWEMKVDRDRMNILEIPLSQITGFLEDYSEKYSISTGDRTYYIKAGFDDPNRLLGTAVKNLAGKAYYFKDFAELSKQFLPRDSFSRFNGENAVVAYVYKESDANTVSFTRSIIEILEQDIQTEILYDQGSHIVDSMRSILYALLAGALISSILIFSVFRNIYHVLPVIAVIPVSFLACFIYMYVKDISLNIMSASAFLFTLGLLYDNSVILIENFENALQKYRRNDLRTIWISTVRMAGPMLIATFTTFSVFLPLFFLQKEIVGMYADFARVLSFSLFFSFVIALLSIPYFFYHMPRQKRKIRRYRTYEYINLRLTGNLFAKRRIIMICTLIFLVIGGYLFNDMGYMNISNTPDNIFMFLFQPGVSMTYRDFTSKMKEIEKGISGIYGVAKILSTYNGENARIIIEGEVMSLQRLKEVYAQIEDMKEQYPDIYMYLLNAPGEGIKEISLNIYGDDVIRRLRTAEAVASDLREEFQDTISQVVIKERNPEEKIYIIPDRVRLAMADISIREASYLIRAAIEGPRLKGFSDGEELKFIYQSPDSIEDIENIILRKERHIRLKDIAEIKKDYEIASVNHENGRALVRVGIMFSGVDEKRFSQKIRKFLDNSKKDILYDIGADTARFLGTGKSMRNTVGITFIILFLILYMYYGNIFDVMMVFSVIPITLAFIVIIMQVFSLAWSIPVYIALILLAGIMVNNSIFIIDSIKKDSSVSLLFRVVHGINNKFRAVIITSLTTILSLFPLLLSRSFWKIMGIVAVSGLVISTLISLYILPVLYYSAGRIIRKD